jgi:hypothetical protein
MYARRRRRDEFTVGHRRVGQGTALAVFVLGVAYVLVTALGFLSIASPDEPIGYPYVTVMELLIIPLAALYLVTMVAVHAYARPERRVYGLIALVLMAVATGITTSVHFVILTVGPGLEATGESWVPLLVSFTWPSVGYALDILAWDWFFALSLLAAAAVFGEGRLERAIRTLLVAAGVLSLLGLLGVPLADMQVRNVGVVGYAVVAPVAFLLIGVLFGRTRPDLEREDQDRESPSAA